VVLLFDAGGVNEDDRLCSSLRDVLVLELLAVAETVHLVKVATALERLGVAVGRSHDAKASASDVSESAVEAVEVSSVGEEDAEGNFFLFGALEVVRQEHDAGVNSEGECVSGVVRVGGEGGESPVVVVEISLQSSFDHFEHSAESVAGLLALDSVMRSGRMRREAMAVLCDVFGESSGSLIAAAIVSCSLVGRDGRIGSVEEKLCDGLGLLGEVVGRSGDVNDVLNTGIGDRVDLAEHRVGHGGEAGDDFGLSR
jgi:hypothetical protein